MSVKCIETLQMITATDNLLLFVHVCSTTYCHVLAPSILDIVEPEINWHFLIHPPEVHTQLAEHSRCTTQIWSLSSVMRGPIVLEVLTVKKTVCWSSPTIRHIPTNTLMNLCAYKFVSNSNLLRAQMQATQLLCIFFLCIHCCCYVFVHKMLCQFSQHNEMRLQNLNKK